MESSPNSGVTFAQFGFVMQDQGVGWGCVEKSPL